MQQLAESYPVEVICRVWEMQRSTNSYHSPANDEHELRTRLQRLAGEWPRYGSRRLTAQLQREGFAVNRNTSNVSCVNCVSDSRDGCLHTLHSRVVSETQSRSEFTLAGCESRRWLLIPRRSITRRKRLQYAALAYTARLQQVGAQRSQAQVGAAWQNGYAERLMRTIKEEEVDVSEYEDYTDASRQLGRFPGEVYLRKRMHSSLGYLTPIEFEQHWHAQHLLPARAGLR